MRYIFFVIIFGSSCLIFGQADTGARDPANQQDFECQLVANHSAIVISKYKFATHTETTLLLKTETATCEDSKGISLSLASGEIVHFSDVAISCTITGTNAGKISGQIVLTPELYKIVSQTEIVAFRLGNTTVPVEYKEKGENLKELFILSETE